MPAFIKRFLLSARTVIVLISAAAISCIIGSLVPQLGDKPPQYIEAWKAGNPRIYYWVDLLQFDHVFTSAWFFVLVSLITLSLSLSIFYQIKALMKSGRVIRKEITPTSFKDFCILKAGPHWPMEAGMQVDIIKKVFKDRSYRPYQECKGNRYIVFEKNRTGMWGSVVFHAGLLIIIIAALYVLAFQKKGFIQLIETDTFQGGPEEWRTMNLGVLARDFHPDFQLRLNKFIPEYWENNTIRNLGSNLIINDNKGGSRELPLSLLNPIEVDGVKIHQSLYYGYSVGLSLVREGKETSPVHFLLDAPNGPGKPFTGGGGFPDTGYIMDMKFYPDLAAHSLYAVFPGVELTVTEKGRQLFKGMLLLNQGVQFGKDTLTFAKIHYWSGLSLTSNHATPLIYFGFALSTLGAFMIFMLSYKEIQVKIVDEEGRMTLFMGGRSKAHQAIFSEEFREIAAMLEKVLGEYGNHRTA